jgi:two-component system, cell cycle sensor histidine kinase and response regulator CckA
LNILKHTNNNNNNNTHLNSNSLSILIVDDNFDIVRLVKSELLTHGFKVSAFTDSVIALDYFRLNCKTCNLILSDTMMPEMNGYEFVRKAKEIDEDVKVVLMSVFEINDEEFHNVLSDIKVDGFLQKPFSMWKLNDVVDKMATME